MKRYGIILGLILTFSLVGCGNQPDETTIKEEEPSKTIEELLIESYNKTKDQDDSNSSNISSSTDSELKTLKIEDTFGLWADTDDTATIALMLIDGGSLGSNLFKLSNIAENQSESSNLVQGQYQLISNEDECYIELDDGMINKLEILEENNELVLKNDELNLEFYLLEKFD